MTTAKKAAVRKSKITKAGVAKCEILDLPVAELARLKAEAEEPMPIRTAQPRDELEDIDLDRWWADWSRSQVSRSPSGLLDRAPRGPSYTPVLMTSETSPLKVDYYAGLPRTWGKFGGTFLPGKQDGTKWHRDLTTDLRVLADEKVDVLISLPEDFELADRKVSDLALRAREYGITVIRFPMPDHCPPASIEAAKVLVDNIISLLKGGLNVVVHCVGGRGRTGTIAGAVLVAAGMGAMEALKTARAARVGAAENPAQERFVQAYSLLYGSHSFGSSSVDYTPSGYRGSWPRR